MTPTSDTPQDLRTFIDYKNSIIANCIDSGARTDEAKAIYETSRRIAREIVGDNTPEDRIRQRCVVSTGDPQFKDLMQFRQDPIQAGIKAIRAGAPIYTDIRMVEAGITKHGHKCPITCVLERGGELAQTHQITRTSAGFLDIGTELEDSIIVIGNAPSAAITVCRLVEQGIRPALIVATPVGFVNAAESKELVRRIEIANITCTGTRGGTPVAVSVVNELVAMAQESS